MQRNLSPGPSLFQEKRFEWSVTICGSTRNCLTVIFFIDQEQLGALQFCECDDRKTIDVELRFLKKMWLPYIIQLKKEREESDRRKEGGEVIHECLFQPFSLAQLFPKSQGSKNWILRRSTAVERSSTFDETIPDNMRSLAVENWRHDCCVTAASRGLIVNVWRCC